MVFKLVFDHRNYLFLSLTILVFISFGMLLFFKISDQKVKYFTISMDVWAARFCTQNVVDLNIRETISIKQRKSKTLKSFNPNSSSYKIISINAINPKQNLRLLYLLKIPWTKLTVFANNDEKFTNITFLADFQITFFFENFNLKKTIQKYFQTIGECFSFKHACRNSVLINFLLSINDRQVIALSK